MKRLILTLAALAALGYWLGAGSVATIKAAKAQRAAAMDEAMR